MKAFVITIDRHGMCHMAAPLASYLAKHCDATMIGPSGTAQYIEGDGKAMEINFPFHRYDPRYFPKLLQLIRMLRREADIIHLQDLHPVTATIMRFAGKAKVVFTLHDINPHPGEVLWYSRLSRDLMVKRADAVLVHGENLKNDLLKEYPGIGDKVHVIFHPVRTIFDKHQDPNVKEGKNLLFFGRIVKYKGLDVLLKAAPRIHEALPDYTITVAGPGDMTEYQPLLKDCSDYVEVDNRLVPDDMVAKYYQRCCMLVAPYIEASQSGVLATAYAFHKPVIATRVGGLPDVVDEGETGMLIPPGDVDALVEAVVKLAKDEDLRMRMKPLIARKVARDLSWERAAEMTYEIYQSLLR